MREHHPFWENRPGKALAVSAMFCVAFLIVHLATRSVPAYTREPITIFSFPFGLFVLPIPIAVMLLRLGLRSQTVQWLAGVTGWLVLLLVSAGILRTKKPGGVVFLLIVLAVLLALDILGICMLGVLSQMG